MSLESVQVKKKKIFIEGEITPEFISNSIAKHQDKKNIGAHNLFLGQVRADVIDGKKVKAIEYTAYREMAEKAMAEIRETAFDKFNLVCMHTYHSLGMVASGQICLFVFVSSKHRDVSYEASRYVVEEIKAKVPIFGKELFEDDTHQWKENSQ